jgi:hypothetical protein
MQQMDTVAFNWLSLIKKLLFVLLGALIIAAAIAYVYYQNATAISFETRVKQYDAIENQVPNSQIQVITSVPEQPVYGLKTADQTILQTADYSKSFLVIAFFGLGSSDQDEITNIWQRNGDIWVQAKFVNPPENSEKVSPYQIIKVDKAELTQFGDISFRLLDSEKLDKGKIRQTITPKTGYTDSGT